MKFSSEFKIGITSLLLLAVTLWGVKYLLGSNLFSSRNTYFLVSEETFGLEKFTPITMNGFQIGQVTEVSFSLKNAFPILVTLEIDKAYCPPKKATAILYSADLLGSKALKIVPGSSSQCHQSGDTLLFAVEQDMLSSIGQKLPQLLEGAGKAIHGIDSLSYSLRELLESETIARTTTHLEKIMGELQNQLSEDGNMTAILHNLAEFSKTLSRQKENLESGISNFAALSQQLKDADIDSTLQQIQGISTQLTSLLSDLQAGKGSAGKLLKNDSLYNYLTNLSADLDSLVIDLKKHPGRYVNFSVFERK